SSSSSSSSSTSSSSLSNRNAKTSRLSLMATVVMLRLKSISAHIQDQKSPLLWLALTMA
ncbi:unnamed protein product, partial [Rotaria magnacalcarata]